MKYIKYLHGDHLHLEIIGKLIPYAKQQEMNFVNTFNTLLTHTSCYVLPNFPPDFPFFPSLSHQENGWCFLLRTQFNF